MTNDSQLVDRRLVVLRHVKCASGLTRLTAEGQDLAIAAALYIQDLNAGPVDMFTSEDNCAILTGEAIARPLGCVPQAVPWLYSDERPPDALDSIIDALRALEPDGTLVLITHAPQVEKLTGVEYPVYCTPYLRAIPV